MSFDSNHFLQPLKVKMYSGRRRPSAALQLDTFLPLQTKTDPLWNLDTKGLFYIREESSSCISESLGEGLENVIVSDDFKLFAKDLAKLNVTDDDRINTRPIAVLQGSSCVFGTWGAYLADFTERLNVVKEAGAVGVVFFEAHEYKLPQHMTTLQTAIPACSLAAPELLRLATTVDWKLDDFEYQNNPAFANFELAYLYNALDEPVPNPIITYIDISHLSVPALTATFNPLDAVEVSGPLVKVLLNPLCLSEEFNTCVECWATDPLLNRAELQGAIAFFTFEESLLPGCFNYYYQWAITAQEAGAIGVVYGSVSDQFYHLPGPYLVPAELKILFFTIMGTHSDTAEHSLLSDTVQAILPAVVDGSAPVFFSDEREDMGFTVLGFWGDEEHLFHCRAGQATYNPWEHPGIAPAFIASALLDIGVVEFAEPITVCSSSETCPQCLSQEVQMHIKSAESAASRVLVMKEEDFPCYHTYTEFTSAATGGGADALVLVNVKMQSIYTMGALGANGETRFAIPSFNVDGSCGERLEYPGLLHAHTPEIANGSAVLDDIYRWNENLLYSSDLEEEELTFLEIVSYHEDMICEDKKCAIGQAGYNPNAYSSVVAEVLAVNVMPQCVFQFYCIECDELENQFQTFGEDPRPLQNDEALGKLVLLLYDVGVCLHPVTNIVHHFDQLGAAAVLFINGEETTYTMNQMGMAWELNIPTFNIAKTHGTNLLNQALQTTVHVRIPRIVNGVGVVDSTADGQNYIGKDYVPKYFNDDSDTGSRLKIPYDIIFGVVGGVCFLGILIFAVWFYRRRQLQFQYEQFDMGIQTGDAFLNLSEVHDDVSSTPTSSVCPFPV
ncbi:hypothetical protein CYMTET_40467 [Cymbomonas tetramitiformis]|uniref:PA domain-containing protein n=1 Tax=Cymbomonas tetramitiformis TaxID=36881 RepID=A0AAE0F2Y6_9CHLO|nr:hypothetical protein CYMTET_40467 [Cymbomonas tetramitiformis]